MHCNSEVQLRAMDVMLACVQHEPQLLRDFLLREGGPPKMANGGINHSSLFDMLIG